MRSPNGLPLDRRRLLQPRDYATDPWQFGIDPNLSFVVPPGGDVVSRRVAEVQHRLVCAWRASGTGRSGAQIAREWAFSRQTWSRTVLGQRWAGGTVLAALLAARRPPVEKRDTASPS